MKHIFSLLAAMFLAIAASAQSVVWCPPGAEWHYDAGAFATSGYVELKYVSDTIVSGKPCKKLVEHFHVINQHLGITEEMYTDHYTYEEDGKVYGISTGNFSTSTSWQMMYDFNAGPGDSWPMYGTNGQFQVTVGDTGSVFVQGQRLKWLGLPFVVGDDLGMDTIYERIGHRGYNYPWIPSVMSTDPHIYSLCNYSDSEITDWRSPGAICRILPPVSSPEIAPETNIEVFPNPTSANFTIHFESGNQPEVNLELRDVFGRIVLQEKHATDRNEAEVSLSEYPAGLYFLRVSGQNMSYTTRVLKQ